MKVAAISNQDFVRALATALLALSVSAPLIAGAYLALFDRINPQFLTNSTVYSGPVTITGGQFRPVVFGDGGFEGITSVLNALEDGEGIVEVIVEFAASSYPLLRVETTGIEPGIELVFYWRPQDRPELSYGMSLHQTRDGTYWHNLAKGGYGHAPAWFSAPGCRWRTRKAGIARDLGYRDHEPFGRRRSTGELHHQGSVG